MTTKGRYRNDFAAPPLLGELLAEVDRTLSSIPTEEPDADR